MLARHTISALSLVCLVSLTGCFKQQVIVDSSYESAKMLPDFEKTHIHVLGVINLDGRVNLEDVCPNGAGMVENKTLFRSDALPFIPFVGFLLGFPFGPTLAVEQYAVYCKN
ncbi:MAG: hypothetical protein VYE40_13110 [Myxococcota bacterium]|nr:hypothetical protein [Myxococcota bacterium]